MSRRRPREVFLSHATADRAVAKEVVRRLWEKQIKCWFPPYRLRGSQAWQRSIGEALQRCDWMVVLISPDAIKSMWVEREVEYALANQRYMRRIVPVVVRPCDASTLSWVFVSTQRVDLTGRRRERPALLRVWGL